MNKLIEKQKHNVRGILNEVAILIDEISGSAIHPWHISTLSLLGHFIVAASIITGSNISAAILLLGFGLLDGVDGALARRQGRSSDFGMLLDSSFDRIKEILIFGSLIFVFATNQQTIMSAITGLALGFSMLVSYVKAKGEVALLSSGAKQKDINRVFQTGLFSFEIRILIVILALLFSRLELAVVLILFGSFYTFITRFIVIFRRIRSK